MPLVRFLEDFGLDAELIQRDREMSAGLGRAHERHAGDIEDPEARFINEIAAATEFRRAGAHSILLSDRRAATEHFMRAGRCYARVANAYSLLMFACAGYSPEDLRGTAHEFRLIEHTQPDRLDRSYLLLAAAAGGWERDLPRHLHDELRGSRMSPVGVLGLPVGAYLDLARALPAGETDVILRTLVPFVFAHSTAMTRARDNNYHWRMMALPFHPADPDVLSVIFLAEAAARSRDGSVVARLLERTPLAPESADLIYNAVSERFGGQPLRG